MKKNLGANTLAFPTPVYIVGTYGQEDEPTAMNVAWGGLCSSEPPCVMIAVRKGRYTYDNIVKNKAFTVNIPDADHVAEADYFGLVSGKNMRKFDVVGLTPVKAENVNAPIIEEFPVAMECKFLQSVEVGQHNVIIGEIVNVVADEACLNEKGAIDIEKVKPMAYNPAANRYDLVGEKVADAFSAGLGYLKK